MKKIIFYARTVEGNFESRSENEEKVNQIKNDFESKRREIEALISKKIGIKSKMLIFLGIPTMENQKEIDIEVEKTLVLKGFRKYYMGDFGHHLVIETPQHKMHIVQSADSGQDSWGDVCTNMYTKVTIIAY